MKYSLGVREIPRAELEGFPKHPSLRWGLLGVICVIYSCRTLPGNREVTLRVNKSQINHLHSSAKRGQLFSSRPELALPSQGFKAAAVVCRQMA